MQKILSLCAIAIAIAFPLLSFDYAQAQIFGPGGRCYLNGMPLRCGTSPFDFINKTLNADLQPVQQVKRGLTSEEVAELQQSLPVIADIETTFHLCFGSTVDVSCKQRELDLKQAMSTVCRLTDLCKSKKSPKSKGK